MGKTELVKQFFRDYPHFYYLADKLPESIQLREIARKVGDYFHDTFVTERGFDRWQQFFAYLFSTRGPLVAGECRDRFGGIEPGRQIDLIR